MSVKTPVAILADAACQDWLRARAGDGFELTARNAAELAGAPDGLAGVRLLVVQMDGPEMHEYARLIEHLSERQPELPVIALGSERHADAMLAAMRAGVRDFLVPGRDDATVVAQMERALRRGAQPGPGRGQLLAVLSGHSSTGTAFLAVHLALLAAEHFARREPVLLLDLAQPAGAASLFLNLHQEYSALNAIQDAYRCDQTLVDTAFGRHGSGLYLLSLPEAQLGAATVDAEELARLLDVLRGLFGMVVVAIDAAAGQRNLQALIERANQSLLLGDQTILSSRFHQSLLRELKQAGCALERIGLVVERYQRKLGLEPGKLAELLQLPLAATLGGDGLNRVQAMNTGEPLFSLAPRDEYAQGVRRLAQRLFDRRANVESEPRRSLLGRLLD